MQALFEAVRQACAPREWSRGVELGRGGAVVVEQAAPEEIILRMASRAGMTSPRVTLWPEERDWSCDCATQEDVCAHVAAAVITLHRAAQEGRKVPSLEEHTAGRLRYCFRRSQGGLSFERVVVYADKVQPLESSLSSYRTGRPAESQVITTQADLAVDLVLGLRRRGPLPREIMPKLLTALARCSDVRLDDVPIKTLGIPMGVRACVVDAEQGFRLFVEPEMLITERFHHNLVLCRDTLRLLGETGLTARERETLPQGRLYTPAEALALVTEVLPDLRKRLPVEIRTQHLPRLEALPPRLLLDVERSGETLTVLPTLVYGDPPTARIDAGQLVHLGGAIPHRDEAAEKHLVQHLRRVLDLTPGHKRPFVGEEAVRFARRLTSWKGEIRGNAHKTFITTAPLVPQLRLEAGTFDFWCESTVSSAPGRQVTRRVQGAAVLRAWQDGATLFPLSEGGWAPLPQGWLQRFGPRVADLLAARQEHSTLPPCALPDLARLCDALEHPRPPECAHIAALLDDFHGIPPAVLPPTLRATLRPYQHRGASWLAFLRQTGLGAMLADDMGLGKTLQALAILQGRTLVVAPTSVLYHWAHELQRFRPDLRVAIYHGPQRVLEPGAEVTLSTYAILRLDVDRLAEPVWDTVILDEAQSIKNPESQVAQAAYRLQAHFRLTLTGTPVENRLEELWSQFHFLNRGLLGGRQDFQQRYARPMTEGRPEALERLREKLKPFVLRRRKREVTPELPARTEAVLYCELSDEERVVYDAIRAATLPQVIALLEAGGSVMAALEALLRLRQACCHTGLVPGQVAAISTKVSLLLERLEEALADGHKALVFSQWTALLDRVEPHLRAAHLSFTRLDGSTRDRAGVVRRFQDEAGPPIMLVSLRAGGTGLNLTAADHVFLLDPWWNPAVEDQAADRAHRLGQTKPVFIYRVVAQNTVEERILVLQERKRALAGAALDGTDQATAITREELLALLT